MDERKNEIGFVLSMIQNLCEEAQIALVAKELKGNLGVVIVDARDGKEYVMQKVGKTNA
ncbi:TPA: hypothetical protein K8M95_001483 [Clostridium perfringens]|uniref:hypothetical protein n=1 Tax=Clostridium perfringens TaxID=1502 RepID=UPI001A287D4F|nr:hypothetical protein [Clostridium perfringens]ELC8382980.1 hypothetical protein [Clostridium perfringens]MDT7912173.1 hypothetical protein [Clostridium perfringens]MDT7925232.1 hypothetical protein [Clostridium perfringens]MDT7958544.1 hypothetical protein [Clostridium perfringens]MDT7975246.1 hypothetical protein [Clostridium perfringens]